uniref:Toll-like receptor 9 n=1 Tax=Ornithorhynchus anatinus TaxID=9258 RepID=A0A6I8NX02_ORNAN
MSPDSKARALSTAPRCFYYYCYSTFEIGMRREAGMEGGRGLCFLPQLSDTKGIHGRCLGSLLILAQALARALAPLPIFLPCQFHHPGEVDCDNHGLRAVPTFATAPQANVTALLLRFNRIHHLHAGDFTRLTNLRQLNLKWNCPPAGLTNLRFPCRMTIEAGTFVELRHLEMLDLSANSISTVPPLPASLQTLSLTRTQVLSLDPATFSPLLSLRQLFMDGNCYYKNPCGRAVEVPPGALAHLGNLTRLSLKYNNLTGVPRGLPPSLQHLYISYNRIKRFSATDLAGLPRLQVLDLSGNCRRCDHALNPCVECNGSLWVEPSAFRRLGALEGLVLADSSLHQLDARWFQGLGNLRVLDLSENFLYRDITTSTAFRGLAKLEKLLLAFNYQKKVSFAHLALAPSFRDLESLQELDMRGIFFRTLTRDTLRPLQSLRSLHKLHLQMNFISQVDLSVFGDFRALKFVDLSDNKIVDHREGGAGGRPGGFGGGWLRALASRGRRGRRPPAEDRPGPDVFMPACRYPEETLDLSRNNLVTIRPDMFSNLSGFKCLRLSRNGIAQAVDGTQFTPLAQLRLLDLSHNKLDLYHGSSFSELPLLEALDLGYNSQAFMMRGIGHNLSFVGRLPRLRFLSLAHNQIARRVSPRLCSTSLEALDFSGNRLDVMWREGDMYLSFFRDLSGLTRLDLSQNRLGTLPDRALACLPPTLRVLWARGNHLSFFNWTSLQLLPGLEELDLSGNRLAGLANGSLPAGTGLRKLVLSGNRLDYIASGFFSGASQLSLLNLSHNALGTVERAWFGHSISSLRLLDIRANPLLCTCDSTFLAFVLAIQDRIPRLTDLVVCGAPYQLKGRSIFTRDLRFCPDGALSCSCFALSSLAVIALLSGPTLHHLYGWDLWYIFHLGLARLRGWRAGGLAGGRRGRGPPGEPDPAYDAFVAFDKAQGAVADWVYHELRVTLEEKSRFRLCLEERDWLPGKSLIENLWNSVYGSHKTVFVLSAIRPISGLLRASFLLAQQRLLDDKQDVVVLVILGQPRKRSRYLLLRQRLCPQTVLFWPRQPSGQGDFWRRLRAALGKDNRHFYDRNFCRGF